MKVKLLKRVGDHPEGKELEILDETVLKAWVDLGVIDNPFEDEKSYSDMKVDELKKIAEDNQIPREEWEKLKKEDLVKYLTEKVQ